MSVRDVCDRSSMRTYAWKSRPANKSRTTCDQCGSDYADKPTQCVTVTLRTHPLYSQTVCRECIPDLGITGCAYRHGEPVEYLLGTAPPPQGWRGRATTVDEALDALSNGTYRLPKPPADMRRLDIGKLVAELWRPGDGSSDKSSSP